MANLTIDKRMSFWKIEIGGQNVTSLLKNLISSISVTYKVNGANTANIVVNSKSYIEDYFVEGSEFIISMGFQATSLITMFVGRIIVPPQGKAAEIINYSIVAAGKSLDLAKVTKQRRFQLNQKAQIINQVIAENGFLPSVDIGDSNPIKITEAPIQNNTTDWQFLKDQAEKWNCLMWVDEELNTIYFVDSAKAHDTGNLLKKINIDDLDIDYKLGYRTSGRTNNVANLSWKFAKSQGSGEAVTGKDENGVDIKEPEDYDVEVEGVFYKIKPELLKKFKEDYSGLGIGNQLALNADTIKSKDALRTYFVPVTKGSATNKNKSHMPTHNRRNVELTASLNIGDPYLRVPRKASIKAGTLNPRADISDLPSFLYATNELKKYNINQVTTGIQNGMMQTSIIMTR